MTIWSDYKPLPADNVAAPPVGAPEGMWPSATNDVLREVMSVINKLGQQVTDTFAGLGSMANQSAANVNITGGTISGVTISGNGGGLTNLNASNLATGTVPAARMAGYYDISVTQANNANTVGGISPSALIPIGGIIAWWGNPASLDPHWHVCDGTGGTPDLRDKYLRGVGSGTGLGSAFGSYTGSSVDAGNHSHGTATGAHTLTIAEMPSHAHSTQPGWSFMNNPGPAGYFNATALLTANAPLVIGSTGGDQGHTHPIGNDGTHSHTINTDAPPSIGVYWIMRMS
jgi:hypothetical protein